MKLLPVLGAHLGNLLVKFCLHMSRNILPASRAVVCMGAALRMLRASLYMAVISVCGPA